MPRTLGPLRGLLHALALAPAIRLSTVVAAVAFASASTTESSGRAAATQIELDAFKGGRKLYEDGKHADAAQYFALAVDGPTPTITDAALVNQARMIRGASAMYLGRLPDADAQFERILASDPKFEPDALLFPPGVRDEFRRIREKLEKAALEKAKGDEKSREIVALRAERTRLVGQLGALRAYASEERVVARRSRLIATIPFGVGQFQNGEFALGVFFAATQGITLGAATVSFLYHQSLPVDPENENDARNAASTARIINWISLGSFVALAVGGIVQSHIAFVPETHETRTRPLPKGLALRPLVGPLPGGAFLGIGALF